MYGRGHSERGLARGLRAAGAADADVLVATKWFPLLRTARDIPISIHDRIHALEDYSIDLYYIHQPWSFSSPEAQMAAMAELVETGLIRAIGVSNFNAEQMRRAHAALAQRGLTLAANQIKYSLLDREIERNGVLETARELGVTLVAWGPLASGLLTGKFHADGRILARTPLGRRLSLQRQLAGSIKLIETLNMIASRYDATPAQVALSWVIQVHGDRIVAIPGASDSSHAREAAGAMRLNLTQAELAELDAVSRPDRQASAY
jgi:aryl-alcohol dehydrogenase-like predicted oxidoreductase